MTITTSAQLKAAQYGISEAEIAAVVAEPETTAHGKRNTIVLSRVICERTIVVVTDYAREVVITTHVPDHEWSEMAAPERRLTAHARERMAALGLVPADLDFVIANATKRDGDGKGNTRSHLIHEGRYLVVVTDAFKAEVVTVICRDSLWSGISIEEAAAAARTAPECSYEQIIANLREQKRNEVAEALQERDVWRLRAEEAEQRIEAVRAMLAENAAAA